MLDISSVTENLFVGSHVHEHHIDDLEPHDFDLIISMIAQDKPSKEFYKRGLHILWIRAIDSFLTPISMKKLALGVRKAVPVIRDNKKVLVFCHQGKRRSVTMATCILIGLGYSVDEAIRLILQKRPVAAPMLWYVKHRIKKFARYIEKGKINLNETP